MRIGRRRVVRCATMVVPIVAAAAVVLLGAGCGSTDGAASAATTSPAASGSPAPDLVQAAPLQHVTVGDISVGYRVIGPLAPGAAAGATPLLMIIGYSSTMDLWPPELIGALAQGRQVVVFDNRGIGETDNPMGPYPFSQMADDTAGLIEALGYQRMDVMGWSMGGQVAIDLTVRHPDVVERLVSYAGDPGGAHAILPTPAVLAKLTDTSGTAEQRGERLLKLLFTAAYRETNPDYWKAFPTSNAIPSAEAVGLQGRAMGTWTGVWGRLKDVKAPALFVTGTDDVLTPPQNALLMTARVPGSWLARFPGAGHGLMYQDPQGLADAVDVFLAAQL